MTLNRRRFIKTAITASTVATLPRVGLGTNESMQNQTVVIVGGGFAGSTAAKYIKIWSPNTNVVIVERNAQFISCPQSNLVLSGQRTMQQLTIDYHGLTDNYGIDIVQGNVVSVDSSKQQISLQNNDIIDYDRLILAPGVDFIYDEFPELENHDKVLHAWKAGHQTELLYSQLQAMKQGGTVIMTVPPTPYKCPPGPYERACQIAYFLKQHNPTGKLVILDANADVVSKKSLFKSAWEDKYSGLIDYIPNSTIESIDLDTLSIETEFENYQADVLNFIPPQKAGKVADIAGVINIDKRWCEVDFLTYESTAKKNIHVIGDAVYAKLPKSGHMANAQAKVCAAAITSLFLGQKPEQEPVFSNTCYSFVDSKQAGHVAAVYRYSSEKKKMIAMPRGGVSSQASTLEGEYANAWAKNIWADTLK